MYLITLWYATYVLNRTAIKRKTGRLKGTAESDSVLSTPYEMVFHETPSIKHLRPFGCPAYVHAKKSKRASGSKEKSKLPPFHRAEKGILLGYASDIIPGYGDQHKFHEVL